MIFLLYVVDCTDMLSRMRMGVSVRVRAQLSPNVFFTGFSKSVSNVNNALQRIQDVFQQLSSGLQGFPSQFRMLTMLFNASKMYFNSYQVVYRVFQVSFECKHFYLPHPICFSTAVNGLFVSK